MKAITKELLEDRLDQLDDWKECAPEETERYNQQEKAIQAALESGKLCKITEDVLGDYYQQDGWIETAYQKRCINQDLAESGLLERWSDTAQFSGRKPSKIKINGAFYEGW